MVEDYWLEYFSYVFVVSVEMVIDKCGCCKLKKLKMVCVLFFIDMYLYDKCKLGGFIN